MNREFLEKLGLEKETIDEVMREHGKTLNEYKEKAEQVDSLQEQIDSYKEQIAERDIQLETLSEQAKGNEELTEKIEELKQQNEQTAKEYEEKLQKQAFDFTLDKALTNAGVRNTKAVKALLDTEAIKLDGETLLGLDDQLEKLKETDDYLFQSEKPTENEPQIVNPGNPKGKGTGSNDDNPFQRILKKYK